MRQNTIEDKKRIPYEKLMCIVLATAILLATLLGCNVGNLMGRTVNHYYPERVFTVEDMCNQLWIKDMELQEDGSFLAVTKDPWIYVGFEILGNRRPAVVNMVMLSYPEDEFFEIWTVDSYQKQSVVLKPGDNELILTELAAGDTGLRLDLFHSKYSRAKIDKIIINDNAYMTELLCNVFRNFAVIGAGFLLFYLLCICWGRLREQENKTVMWVEAKEIPVRLACFLLSMLGIAVGLWELAAVATIFYFGTGKREKAKTAQKIMQVCAVAGMGILVAVFSMGLQCASLLFVRDSGDKCIVFLIFLCIWTAGKKNFGALLCAGFYLYEHVFFAKLLGGNSISHILKFEFINAVTAMNLALVLVIYLALIGLLGRHLGNLLHWFFTLLYYLACVIKIRYNGEIFRLTDFKLLGELAGIIQSYVPVVVLVLLAVGITAAIVMCIIWRKRVGAFLKPVFHWEGIELAVLAVIGSVMILNGVFSGMGLTVGKVQLDVNSQIVGYGFSVYTLTEFTGNNNIAEPEGYGKEIVAEMQSFKDTSTENDVKPTVILILAESLYDIESVPDLSFNMPVLPRMSEYKLTNAISPSYGGRTAVAEFEALTGLTDMYFTNGAVAYESYLGSGKNGAGGLAREFNNNGYYSVAIHANKEDFYSRGAVYQNMGFDDFISKEDMNITSEDCLGDNYVKDSVFVDYIIDTLDSHDGEPVFIFGASIASHGLYDNKYPDTIIHSSSDRYSPGILQEVDNYSQSIYDLDVEMGRLFDYCDELERPVNIYIFGDHLPSIELNIVAGYVQDPYKMYCTPIYAYSNYTELTLDLEYMSLSQLAPQILRDSGVSYSAYFDALYTVRNTYPVIQKSWDIDVNSPEIQRLYMIEYDLIFGKKYLLE